MPRHASLVPEGGRRRIRSSRWARAIAIAASLVLLPAMGVATSAAPAYAADYPTWDEVQAAVSKESSAKALLKSITEQLAQLTKAADAAQKEAERVGVIYDDARAEADEAALKAQELQDQADKAADEALTAQKLAARLIAASSKVGGNDLTANLLGQASSKETDNLLYKLGAMDKITSRSNGIYTEAVQLQNSAQALTDQAVEAKKVRDELRAEAEAALVVASAAAEKAATALEEQVENQARMEQQVVVLTERRKATQADYQRGIVAQFGEGATGVISASGWAKPSGGYISSQFGRRFHPIYHTWKLHSGTDLAIGCGSPIFAAASGTVIYAGPSGDLGNFLQIQHANGVVTGYAHIQWGGILVRQGQKVGPGQNVARVGTTGGSTGCHLHYMVRINGNLTDPVQFMRGQGIRLG